MGKIKNRAIKDEAIESKTIEPTESRRRDGQTRTVARADEVDGADDADDGDVSAATERILAEACDIVSDERAAADRLIMVAPARDCTHLDRQKRVALAIATSDLPTASLVEAFIAGMAVIDPAARIRIRFDYPRPSRSKAAAAETRGNRRAIGGAGAPGRVGKRGRR